LAHWNSDGAEVAVGEAEDRAKDEVEVVAVEMKGGKLRCLQCATSERLKS